MEKADSSPGLTVIGPAGAQSSVQLSAWGCKPGLCVLNIHSSLSYTQPPGFLLYLTPYQTQHVQPLDVSMKDVSLKSSYLYIPFPEPDISILEYISPHLLRDSFTGSKLLADSSKRSLV